MYDSPDNFGKDIGLIHQIMSGGRTFNLGRQWWKQLRGLGVLQDIVEYLSAKQSVNVPVLKANTFRELLGQFPGRTDLAIYPQDIDSAWWLPGNQVTSDGLLMCLFRGYNLGSEKEARKRLDKWDLRPANTLELISAARAIHELLFHVPRPEGGLPIENGLENHIVALDAKRIDQEEPGICLGMEVRRTDSHWSLHRYDPDGNPGFWEPKSREEVFLLAVSVA